MEKLLRLISMNVLFVVIITERQFYVAAVLTVGSAIFFNYSAIKFITVENCKFYL